MIQELDFESLFPPYYGNTITIPGNTVVWRAFDPKFPILSSRPAFFSSEDIAYTYAVNGKELRPFVLTKPLRVLDYRFLKVLLAQLFQTIHENPLALNDSDTNIISAVIASFGICSLNHQIKLLKYLYKDQYKSLSGFKSLEETYNKNLAIEQEGVRVGETTLDSYTMGFCKEILHKIADGYIAPRLKSPFHDTQGYTLHPELVVFNPIASGIQPMTSYPVIDKIIKLVELENQYRQFVSLQYKAAKTNVMIGSGKTSRSHSIDSINMKYFKQGEKLGKKWNTNCVNLFCQMPPRPTVPLAILLPSFEDSN